MKRTIMVFLALTIGICLTTGAIAADKNAIKKTSR
jgi:hypothetical protein